MHGFRDNEVLLQAGYDDIVISPLEGASRTFHDELWKSDHDFLIGINSNFLSAMHGLRDNEVSLQARYDAIVNFPPGGASGDFKDGFWKSDHDFLIGTKSNFLSVKRDFRDNEVSLQAGYNVIAISPPGGASGDSSRWILIERRLPRSVP